MNPVLILTHNCLELTKKCVESVQGQDVPEVYIHIIDNGSSDGTQNWVDSQDDLQGWYFDKNAGVSDGWNLGLSEEFEVQKGSYCLVLNNDTIIPPWFYRELLSYDEPFISGVSVNDMSQIESLPPRCPLRPHPDFSGFLIRREAWKKVGQFDERMKFYASDLDWHIRAHRKGLNLWQANVPFYHERSSTLKNASAEDRSEIEAQANRDRAELKAKWGCDAWAPSYDSMFADELFGCDANA